MDSKKTDNTANKYRFPGKRRLRYQLKLFLIAIICLWGVVGVFAGLEYRNVKRYRVESLASSVDLAVGNILAGHDEGRDMRPFMNFLESYLEDSPLKGMSMSIYDAGTGRLLYSHGPAITEIPAVAVGEEPTLRADGTRSFQVFNLQLKDGRKIFLYNKGESADGEIIIHTYLPQSGEVDNAISIGPTFWLIVLFVGLVGTVAAWVVTAHQAKNISLLHDFASRAASDREFIPMGDFPKDEIGDISRQIVAIYNARMQANVRREREHVIALKATEEKNNLKRVMTNNISHELKTPIGIIRSYLEMILSNPDISADERNYFLGKAQNNVERLVAMMNDLSTMTRLEESNDKIPISDIDFHDLVFSLAEDFTQSGLLKSMDFRYNIPLDCHVYGNGELLIGMLSNLTKNAVAYSQGTETGIVLMGRNANFYTFSFYDNGVGVGEEHLSHLFDRFYRIDTGRSRKVGGTGLGLPIVKSAVNTMGGSITVRNRRGGGLEFVFTLRRVKDAANGDGTKTSTPVGDNPETGCNEGKTQTPEVQTPPAGA